MKRAVLYLFAAIWIANTLAFIFNAATGFVRPITVGARAVDAALGIAFGLLALWAAHTED